MEPYTGVSFILIFVTCTIGERVACPQICKCPDNKPCPPGTPSVPDPCGCGCRVCIQDLGAQCDGLRPCDPTKNLSCDYQGDPERQQGVCKVLQEPGSCFHNGSKIQHGQEFRMACDRYCKCENGIMDCMPLCPKSQEPLLPHCKEVTVPGECCKQWRCSEKSSRDQEGKIHRAGDSKTTAPETSITAGAKIRISREAPDSDTEEDYVSATDAALCKTDTDWTPCSRSCGFGNSVQITYDKESCIPKVQRRLCMIRPCKGQYASANYTVLKSSNVCSRVTRWSQPLHLRFRDCRSHRPHSPRFCGHCSDGRFCTPTQSETRHLSFQCAHRQITRKVMWVVRCQCGGKKRNGHKRRAESVLQSGGGNTNEVEGRDSQAVELAN